MSEIVATQGWIETRDRSRRHPLLAGLLLGIAIGGLGFAIVATTVDVVGVALARQHEEAAAALGYPARPLPAEWRWAPRGVDVDSMYGDRSARPGLDWIRSERTRRR